MVTVNTSTIIIYRQGSRILMVVHPSGQRPAVAVIFDKAVAASVCKKASKQLQL